jgi:hypothetical protein
LKLELQSTWNGFPYHAMNLYRTLQDAGLTPNDRVIQRVADLRGSLKTGKVPADLLQKLGSLPQRPGHQASLLPVITGALRAHHLGVPGSRLEEPFASLADYTLAYFWEERDDISDSLREGFEDDLKVLAQVYRHAKRDLDDLLLRSRRPFIQEDWNPDG